MCIPCGKYSLSFGSNIQSEQDFNQVSQSFGKDAAIKITFDRPGGPTLCNSAVSDFKISINAQDITETAGVTVTQAGFAASYGSFTGDEFTAYNFSPGLMDSSNAELLCVYVDNGGVDEAPVEIMLSTDITDLASAADVIKIAGATVVVDGEFLKIISKTTGSSSRIVIMTECLSGANSGDNALALFGTGTSVAGVDLQASMSGTLKTALTGAGMTNIVLTASSQFRFYTTKDIVIGSTTVTAANINVAGNKAVIMLDENGAPLDDDDENRQSVDDNLYGLFTHSCTMDLKCAAQGIQIANGEYKNNVAQENGGALSTDVGRKNSMFEVKKTTFKSNRGMSMKNSCFYIFLQADIFLFLSYTH